MADDSDWDVNINYMIHHSVVQESVLELANWDKFVDLCFVCNGGVKVHCHKLVICTVSIMLKEVFMSIPYCEDKIITVYVPDIDSGILQMVLDFVYKGCITVNREERKKIAETTKFLGITLLQNTDELGSALPPTKQSQPAPQQAQPSPQQVQPSPLYTQGQMQYTVPQSQMMSIVQQGISQQPSGQHTLMAQPSGQMVQQVQPGPALQQQQNSMMQVVQQNNTQVVPRSSHMVATNQIVSGNQVVNGPQVVQCSTEMVVQGSQPMMMNSSRMEVGLQNQQQPRYVMSSSDNELTTTRGARQYSQAPGQQPITVNRTRQRHQQMQQTPRMNNGISSEKLKEEVTELLNDLDITKTTISTLQSVLEDTLRCDLSGRLVELRTVVRDWLVEKEALKRSKLMSNPSSSTEKENELEDDSEIADDNGMDISLEQTQGGKKRGRPKAYTLSQELAKLVGKPSMTYPGVFQKIKSLVEKRNLHCIRNRNYAVCDDEMLNIFGVKRFLIKSLMKHLKGHLFCKKLN